MTSLEGGITDSSLVPPGCQTHASQREIGKMSDTMGVGGGGSTWDEARPKDDAQRYKSSRCIPKSSQIPNYVVTSGIINACIQYMKDCAIIGKFLGIWRKEKDLVWWINSKWKPIAYYNLQLGSK